MNKKLICTPIALVIAALVASPAFAQGEPGQERDNITITKSFTNTVDMETTGLLEAEGIQTLDSSASALVNDLQVSETNIVTNLDSTNTAIQDGDALNGAAGNVGVNVAAGENNQQANAAAIAVDDDSFVFSSTDAEVFASQLTQENITINVGQTNTAGAAGTLGNDAAGNIGLNFAAGSSNQQKNDMAIATGTAAIAVANITVQQHNHTNMVSNAPSLAEEVLIGDVDLNMELTGTSTGSAYQMSNIYPDTWEGNPVPDTHPTDLGQIGHLDIDNETQGAVANPFTDGVGGLAFDLVDDIVLSGTVTGSVPVVVLANNIATTNTASLTGTILVGATGNIGVNVAAGSNNQQFNGLAIAQVHP